LHLEHCSSGGASALPHALLPHASAPAAGTGARAAAAFLDITGQGGGCVVSNSLVVTTAAKHHEPAVEDLNLAVVGRLHGRRSRTRELP